MMEQSYDKPGTYLLEVSAARSAAASACALRRAVAVRGFICVPQVPCPSQRQRSVVTLQMTTRNGMLYEVS